MNMKKKEYIEPKVKVVELDYTTILAGSGSFDNVNGTQPTPGDEDEREDVVFE